MPLTCVDERTHLAAWPDVRPGAAAAAARNDPVSASPVITCGVCGGEIVVANVERGSCTAAAVGCVYCSVADADEFVTEVVIKRLVSMPELFSDEVTRR